MPADFWAGYISGAAGILIGNPLDLIKVRLQTTQAAPSPSSPTPSTPLITRVSYVSQFTTAGSLIKGAAAPMLGYGALNALLFVTYNRTSDLLSSRSPFDSNRVISNTTTSPTSLWIPFVAGAIGGFATWVISTPTELIKCRTQLSSSSATSTWSITKSIIRADGIRGLYFGGAVTMLRDSIGYGFYFWSYELSTRFMMSHFKPSEKFGDVNGTRSEIVDVQEAMKVLFCGGIAGVITWASIFPLDVIKTRVQAQVLTPLIPTSPLAETAPLLDRIVANRIREPGRLGAIEIAKNAYRTEGAGVFFRGLGVCSVRAFIVNAAQWAVYEWIMRELGSGSSRRGTDVKN